MAESAGLEWLWKQKERLVCFPPMSDFILFLLCCNLYVLFMGDISCNTFSSWWLGVPLGFPGMQAGLCWFPVAGGVLVISKGVLQVWHLPMAISR